MTLDEFGDEMYLQYKDRLSEYGFDGDEKNSDDCDIGVEECMLASHKYRRYESLTYDYFDAYCVPYGEL